MNEEYLRQLYQNYYSMPQQQGYDIRILGDLSQVLANANNESANQGMQGQQLAQQFNAAKQNEQVQQQQMTQQSLMQAAQQEEAKKQQMMMQLARMFAGGGA